MITGNEVPQKSFGKQQVYGKQTYRKHNSDEVRDARAGKRQRKERLNEIRTRELMGTED